MKVLCVFWFSSMLDNFGIVVALDPKTNKIKAYIGGCQPGGTEDSDVEHILKLGAKFLPEHASTLNKYLNNEDKK